jgi:MFS transporter, DHA1 family, multidrug resistance protein
VPVARIDKPSLAPQIHEHTVPTRCTAFGSTPTLVRMERDDSSHIPRGWRLVLIIGGLSIFGPLCIDMYLPALPRIGRDLHASTSAVQLTITGCLVGIAIGQLVIGPISDREGRRSPLLVGIAAFVLSSLACTLVSSVYLLDGLRFVQGLGGAAGIVIARAIVRDLFEGPMAARFFSTLMLVTGLGPILAPQIGAEILRVTSWRGVFVALAIVASLLLLTALVKVPETLPPERRHAGGLRSSIRALSTVGSDPFFIGYALVGSLGFGAIFAYIAGSPFVLQDIYGLSPQMFGLAFAMNAGGLVLGAQFNGHLVYRVGSGPLLTFGLTVMAVGGLGFLGSVCTGWGGLAAVLPSLFAVLFGLGFLNPNAMALAMQNHPDAAGAASALLGSAQFLLGAAVAPLVGIAGNHNAIPMGIVMAGLTASAVAVRLMLPRREPSGIVPPDAAPIL